MVFCLSLEDNWKSELILYTLEFLYTHGLLGFFFFIESTKGSLFLQKYIFASNRITGNGECHALKW